MLRLLLIACALAMAVVWAALAGRSSYESWPRTDAQLVREREAEIRRCASRYIDASSSERCVVLIETTYVMERNIAIFTRLLIAFGPLVVVAAWAAFSRPTRRQSIHRSDHQ